MEMGRSIRCARAIIVSVENGRVEEQKSSQKE